MNDDKDKLPTPKSMSDVDVQKDYSTSQVFDFWGRGDSDGWNHFYLKYDQKHNPFTIKPFVYLGCPYCDEKIIEIKKDTYAIRDRAPPFNLPQFHDKKKISEAPKNRTIICQFCNLSFDLEKKEVEKHGKSNQ